MLAAARRAGLAVAAVSLPMVSAEVASVVPGSMAVVDSMGAGVDTAVKVIAAPQKKDPPKRSLQRGGDRF